MSQFEFLAVLGVLPLKVPFLANQRTMPRQKSIVLFLAILPIQFFIMGVILAQDRLPPLPALPRLNTVQEYIHRGDQLIVQSRFERAADDFSGALEIEPKNVDAILGRADARRRLEDFVSAQKDLEKALKLAPNNPEALQIRADLHADKLDWDLALADANKAIQLSPTFADAYRTRSRCYRNSKNLELEMEDLDKAVALSPENYLWSAYRAFSRTEIELALQDHARSIELSNRDQYERADALDSRASTNCIFKNFETSMADMESVILLLPDSPYPLVHRAMIRLERSDETKKDLESAIEECTKAIRLDPQFASAYQVRAQTLVKLERNEEAIIDFKATTKLGPRNAFYHFYLGQTYSSQGNDKDAVSAFTRAIAIRPENCAFFVFRAQSFERLNSDAEAIDDFKNAIQLCEAESGQESLETMQILNLLGEFYKSKGKLTDALPPFQRALAIREKVLGSDPETVVSLNSVADIYRSQGNVADAVPLYERALAIREKALGPNHFDVGLSLNNLALIHNALAEYAKALPLFRRALSIFEKSVGPEHPDTASIVNNIAVLYNEMGDTLQALSLYKRALSIREKTLGPNHPSTASSMDGLASIYEEQANFTEALSLYIRVYKIREATLGLRHPETASSLSRLGSIYGWQGNYVEAISYHKKALEITEELLGPNDLQIAYRLNNLAVAYMSQSRFSEAQPLISRALEIEEKSLGPYHPTVASTLTKLASVYQSQAKYPEAMEIYEKALRSLEKHYGPEHPKTTSCQFSIAKLRFIASAPNALPMADRCVKGLFAHVSRIIPSLPLKEQELFLAEKLLPPISAGLSMAAIYPDEASISAAWALNFKGIVHDMLCSQELVSRDIADPKVQQLVKDLKSARGQLASLSVNPAKSSEEANRISLQVDRVMKELVDVTGSAISTGQWIEFSDFRKRLPKKSVFVDFVRFDAYNLRAKQNEQTWEAARYMVWITPASGLGDLKVIDLGLASEIDALLEPVRQAMNSNNIKSQGEELASQKLNTQMKKLADRIWKPIAPHVASAKEIVLSPDGALWLLPWSALPIGENDEMLIEKFGMRMVTSGRNILKSKTKKFETTSALIFADPNFDSSSAEKQKSIEAVLKRIPNAGDDSLRSLSPMSLLPKAIRLPNTASEARFIQPNIERMTGAAAKVYESQYALESIAKEIKHPRVAVFATHGFFLPPNAAKNDTPLGGDATRSSDSRGSEMTGPRPENPLLRCGLLLAGCNNPKGIVGDDDGVLTGIEIVGIDFRGTDLVVLSACETGVGDIRNGQGVAGLRQAFQLAGAKAVVASLWQVPDRDSAIIMSDFFANIADGQSASEAMRQSQLKRIEARRKKFGAAHPIYWAAWTVSE